MKQKSSSLVTLALLLAMGGTSLKASAQTAADNFPMPKTVAAGTKVQIDGSSSLQAVNKGLKEKFQKQFPGTDVVVPEKYQGSEAAISAVKDDKADFAGIGRLLTKEEKGQGLGAKTIGRSKIAIIVKSDNPYTGNLTLKDFAKIYRGEVTDWSQLPSAKGAKGKIKVIDRPDSSDTRRAFANYPVFQNGKLKTGSNAEKLTEDSTQAVVDKLGQDGIGYAPAEQIQNIPGIRAVTLHSTQPDNPKYPFSQPLVYAYKNKDGKVSEGAKAFLGYVNDPAGKTAVAESIAVAAGAATAAATGASPAPAATATGVVTPGTEGAATTPGAGTEATSGSSTAAGTADAGKPKGGFPWWILPILAAGGGLLWLLGRKKPTETVAPITTAPETTSGLKPLYPPSPNRTGAGGDLSGDLSSGLGGFRPSGDLRSGDLRSGDLSSTLPPPPGFTPSVPPSTPNPGFNGLGDSAKAATGGINLPGAAALAGGAAAAAAAGKAIYDGTQQPAAEIIPPEIKAPEIDLSNPLEGLKDKSSNLIPNLDPQNSFDGIKDKAGDLLQGGTGAAVAGGAAALAGGAGKSSGNLFGGVAEEPTPDLNLELPKIDNPLAGSKDQAVDLVPDLNIEDRASDFSDFLKGGGAAVGAAGLGVVAGGAALAGGAGKGMTDFFGGQHDSEDRSEELSLEEPQDGFFDSSFDVETLEQPDTPLETRNSSQEIDFDALDMGAGNDPFDLSGSLLLDPQQAVSFDPDVAEPASSNPFGDLGDRAGDFLKGGGAAAGATGAAALAGGAALFGGNKPAEPPAAVDPFDGMDTFDRDLADITLDGLDDDPFAGLSDLLGEETGEVKSEDYPKPDGGSIASLQSKAADLLEDGKGFGGAALAGGAAAALGATQAAKSFFTGKETPTASGDLSGNLYSEGQITLAASTPAQVYAHWEIPVRLKRQLREQGGEKLMVRLYDVTDNVNSTLELPTTFQEFECGDLAWDLEMPINRSARSYLTEIGYVTGDGRWLMLARSAPVMVPAA